MEGAALFLACGPQFLTARDAGSIPGLGRSLGEGDGNPLQYSCWENPMDRGAWWTIYGPWGHKESDTTEQLSTHTAYPLASNCPKHREKRDTQKGWTPATGQMAPAAPSPQLHHPCPSLVLIKRSTVSIYIRTSPAQESLEKETDVHPGTLTGLALIASGLGMPASF